MHVYRMQEVLHGGFAQNVSVHVGTWKTGKMKLVHHVRHGITVTLVSTGFRNSALISHSNSLNVNASTYSCPVMHSDCARLWHL
jgi:hypothetical protein